MKGNVARASTLFAGVLLAASVVACSGPGAPVVMLQSLWFGRLGLLVQVVLSVGIIMRYRAVGVGPGHPVVPIVFAALHPAWWISAYSGDCGMMRAFATLMFGAGFIALRIWQERLYKRAVNR